MDEPFDLYRAPQFVDLKHDLDDSGESFFDLGEDTKCETTLNAEQTNYFSPSGESLNGPDPLENSYEEPSPVNMRKSISVGNLVLFGEQTIIADDNHVEQPKLCGMVNSMKIQMMPNNKLARKPADTKMHRQMSRDNLDRLAQPKRHTSTEQLQSKPNKFVSMAESILQFQNKTPKRFHSRPDLVPPLRKGQPLQTTVPHSPALKTKLLAKSRPKNNVPSHEEKLQMEFEREQQFKIKANPVNKKILEGPIKGIAHVEKKSSTVPEPFKLTKVAPKGPPTPPQKFEFRAQPVPKFAAKPVKIQTAPRLTTAVTPSFMKHYKKEMVEKHQNQAGASSQEREPVQKPLQPTKVEPFSFEKRDRQVQAKRQQLIQKQIEEEKRARRFQAKPVPKFIHKGSGPGSRNNSATSSTTKSQENLLQSQFKAKRATVLYKEPFVPQKSDRPVIEVQPFPLSTENRAQQREEFERELKEKEARLEAIKRDRERQEQEKQEAEIRRLRKALETRAQPIKKYKEVHIVPSNKVTLPITPKFETDRIRRRENKENFSFNVSVD